MGIFFVDIVYDAIAIFLIYMLIRKKYNPFHVLFFLAPFSSWLFNIGLNLYAFQIDILLLLLWNGFLFLLLKNKPFFSFNNRFVSIFFWFVIIDTLIMSILYLDHFRAFTAGGGGFFRSEGRFISQIFLWIIWLSVIPLVYRYIKSSKDIYRYIKVYVHAILLLVVLGWIQFAAYNTLGFDIFPLDFSDAGDARSGIWTYGGEQIFRMSSLGGEPKDFAVSSIVGFFIIHISNRNKIFYTNFDTLLKYIVLFTAFATLSTSGFVMFAILLPIYYLQLLLLGQLKLEFNLKTIIVSALLVGSISFFIVEKSDFISAVYEERLAGRDIVREDYDAPIQTLFTKEPQYFIFGMGLGNVHHLSYQYIPPEDSYYMANNIFSAKSGYLKMFSEVGVVGFLLFLYMNYRVINSIYRINKLTQNSEIKQMSAILYFLLIIFLFAFFARSYIFPQYILFFAVGLSLLRINLSRIEFL